MSNKSFRNLINLLIMLVALQTEILAAYAQSAHEQKTDVQGLNLENSIKARRAKKIEKKGKKNARFISPVLTSRRTPIRPPTRPTSVSRTNTPTRTYTATATFTRTSTSTHSLTPTGTSTFTATRTATRTATNTASRTPTQTFTPSYTPTKTQTPTRTSTPSPTSTPTNTWTIPVLDIPTTAPVSEPSAIPTLPVVNAPIAGSLAGELSVNDSGAANYKMPLTVPPGTAGLQPALAINYDSRGGDGHLGIGWSISGFSAITRCPATLVDDGFADPVDFDSKDRFCLDGQRLVLQGGTYGKDYAQYRTQNEIFSEIMSLGDLGGAPKYFTVRQKNSLIYEYGNSSDSRYQPQNNSQAVSWNLNKVYDRNGNFYTFTYSQNVNSGELLPSRIDYTGNSNAGLGTYNSVKFEYIERSLANVAEVSGVTIYKSKLLSKIAMYAGEQLAWEYKLNYYYDNLSYQPHLSSVQECGGDGSCIPATSFQWGDHSENLKEFETYYVKNDFSFYVDPSSETATGDWNGDGRSDFAIFQEGAVFFYISTVDSKFSFFGSLADLTYAQNYRSKDTNPIVVGDWNGDGLTDIGRAHSYGTRLYITNPNGTFTLFQNLNIAYPEVNGWGADGYPTIAGDWNGDGRTDLALFRNTQEAFYVKFFLAEANGFTLYFTSELNFNFGTINSTPIFVGDWNGDGKTDLGQAYYYPSSRGTAASSGVVFNTIDSGQLKLFANIPNSYIYDAYTPNSDPNNSRYPAFAYPILIGDWNGDGLTDLGRYTPTVQSGRNPLSSAKLSFWLSTGTGFSGQFENSNIYSQTESSTAISPIAFTGDWNADGKTDVGLIGNATAYFYALNTGNILWSKVLSQRGVSYGDGQPRILIGDWNGDGQTDIGGIDYNLGTFLARKKQQAALLKKITDGFGSERLIEYKPITDSSVYTKGQGATYPNFDVQGTMKVVSSIKVSNGLGTYATMLYSYSGLKASLDGRGSLGFQQMNTIDAQTGIVSSTQYRQDYPFQGSPVLSERKLASGAVIYRKTQSYQRRSYPWNSFFVYIDSSYEETFDLAGIKLSGKRTSWELDYYANPTSIEVIHDDNRYEKTTSTYVNDATNWLLGLVRETRVLSQAPNELPLTKTIGFDYQYSTTTGLLLSEAIEPSRPEHRLIKNYSYDVYGNIIQVQISGQNIQTRTESKTFDARGQFAVQSKNALGHTANAEYDIRHGLVSKLTDPNGLVTSTYYDAFGRPTLTTFPDGTQSRVLYLKNGPDNFLTSGFAYSVRTDTSGLPPLIEYFDSLGRSVRKESTSFDGRKILVDRVYNEKGLVTNQSEPYFEGSSPQWSVTEYDVLARPTYITEPGGRTTRTSYSGLTTIIINPLNQKQIRTVNSTGQLISVQDEMGKTVSYRYDSHGNLISIRDSAGNVTSMEYDLRGNKIKITDPDSGVSTFTYDVLGNVKTETNARFQNTFYTYDLLNRMIIRGSAEGTEYWTYDLALKGLGKVAQVDGLNGYKEVFQYDSLGRLFKSSKTISGKTYSFTQSFDVLGRVNTLTYPTGFAVKNRYNIYGYMAEVRNQSSNALYWKAIKRNAKQQLEEDIYGNGIKQNMTYDSTTSTVSRIKAGNIQDLTFAFDGLGNLKSRSDLIMGLREDFEYDGLNRLISSQVQGQSPLSMNYDEFGNIVYKSDVGTYKYGENGAGPHAVTSIVGPKANTYSYDISGNRIRAGNYENITYTSFNLPTTIESRNTILNFKYSPGRQRIEQVVSVRSYSSYQAINQVERKVYVDGLFEELTSGNSVKNIHYIKSAEGVTAIYTSRSDNSTDLSYLHIDHLGSIQTISNIYGAKTETLSFDAWGNRRNTDWSPASSAINPRTTDRGFTGHEHLDEASLIHMNGRVYDPVIGRFLSPDPVIQEYDNLQNLNRYSYVLNNPLSFTDPSGFFFKKLKKLLKIAAVVAVAFVTQGASLSLMGFASIAEASLSAVIMSGVAVGFSTSIVGSVLNGGSIADGFKAGLRAAPLSAIRAAAAFQIGNLFECAGSCWGKDSFGEYVKEAKAVAHGLTGAAISEVSGGDALSGFLSNSVGSYSTNLTQGLPSAGKFFASVTLGGAASAISGSKFQDGAMGAAVVYLFNDALHPEADNRHYDKNDPNYHSYRKLTWVCFTSDTSCTKDNVFQNLLPRLAPGQNPNIKVSTGTLTEINIAGLSGGNIRHFIDKNNHTAYNVTMPSHIFNPGYVQRSVIEMNGSVFISTYGEGTGDYATMNKIVGPGIFLFKDIQIQIDRAQ